MEGEEDYFGDISVPTDETAEDAANDLTFGDIGDVKAGDEASDALWKPDHATLSRKIEAEKEAFLRTQAAAQPQLQPQRLTPPEIHPDIPTMPTYKFPTLSPQLVAHTDNPAAAWNMLQRGLPHRTQQNVQPPLPQQMPPPTQPSVQPPPVLQQIPLHLQHQLHQPLQQPVHRQPIHQHLPQMPGQLNQPPHPHAAIQARSHAAMQDYQRRLVSTLDQQTRLLLRQHRETAQKQLLEAERAQQAGITFDRKEFDRHQDLTQQRIILEHSNRLRQIQVHVWQMSQQVMQQAAERPVEQIPALDLRRKVESVSPPAMVMSHSPVRSSLPAMSPLGELAVNGAGPANGLDPVHEPEHGQMQRRSALHNTRMPRLSNEELEKAPRLQEIERQMAAAGLGPSAKSRSTTDAFGGPLRRVQDEVESPVKKKPQRRLESMTDRDQELVFRAHLRQIETSVLYKDDYYNSVLKKQKQGNHEIFSELADRLQSLRLRDKQRGPYGHSMRIRSSKRNNTNSENDDSRLASSPQHSDQNMRALANALGTVQSWNPRAPRRVMDFGLLEKKEPGDGAPQKSLREDERVHVRQEVERGYDLIATIHDIARGESQTPLAPVVQSLFSTLHLAERQEDEYGKECDGPRSTRFFATMCIIQKGRRYLSHVLELLEASEKVRVMSAIFENLGMLVFASQKSPPVSAAGDSRLDLFSVMTKIVQDPEIAPQDCLAMFDSFSASHVPHRDAFLTTFRSAIGARLIFLCMQRISAGLSKQKISDENVVASQMRSFIGACTDSLQGMFEGAESESRVWEVMASLDALASGEIQTKYRAELNQLLRAGSVPPPPSA